MDAAPRSAFNRAWTPALYGRYRSGLEAELGPIPFPLAETPFFLTPALRDSLTRSAREIVEELARPDLLRELMKVIPPRYDTPGMDPLPNCVQVDFAVTAAPDGSLQGKVVELQAFPSGYAMMTYFADAWNALFQTIPGLEGRWTCFVIPRDRGLGLMRDTILGGEPPEAVVLVDFEPHLQKTVPDFVATERLFGVESVCATELVKQGRRLFRRKDGQLLPIRRIYNRMVFDELEQKGYQLPFHWNEELEVSWCSHPNWYWPWSKYSLPFLRHPAVPRATFLSELGRLPEDLSAYVLKPLFSFAGSGVVIDVTAEDVARVPEPQRRGWVIQEKVVYAPAIRAPDGAEVKAEVRVMLLRPPGAPALTPTLHLVRLSRGKMLGVDQNKGLQWVGGSVGLWRAETVTP
ncbi:MAG TPA: hypothetical protein VEJ89_08025 [Myxococcaceae bacterium]|jgi:hypothetical protein|nr:hypothetical protein [Myxococcaceae bacterium]